MTPRAYTYLASKLIPSVLLYIIQIYWLKLTLEFPLNIWKKCNGLHMAQVQDIMSYHATLLWWFSLINSSSPDKMADILADDIFKRIFLNENIWISNKISLKYVPWGLIENMLALV